jgi:hypothetical protein
MSGLMERIRKQAREVPFDIDSSRCTRSIRSEVTFRRNPDAEAAIQYLTWALLETIEKNGSEKAANHTRAAIAALLNGSPRPGWDRVSPRQFVPLMAAHINCSSALGFTSCLRRLRDSHGLGKKGFLGGRGSNFRFLGSVLNKRHCFGDA